MGTEATFFIIFLCGLQLKQIRGWRFVIFVYFEVSATHCHLLFQLRWVGVRPGLHGLVPERRQVDLLSESSPGAKVIKLYSSSLTSGPIQLKYLPLSCLSALFSFLLE